MTGADSVAAKSLRTAKETSNDRSLLLCTYFTPHSSLFYFVTAIVVLPPSRLSPSLCFFLFHSLSLSPAWSLVIWWRERLNIWLALENTLVTMLCVFLVCVPYHRGIAERESVAGRGAHKDRNLKMKFQMRIWSFIWLHQQPQIGESAWWDVR